MPKIENLHIDTRRKIQLFHKCFSIYDEKITNLSRKTVLEQWSPGACERLAVLNDPRRQYILLVVIIVGAGKLRTKRLVSPASLYFSN